MENEGVAHRREEMSPQASHAPRRQLFPRHTGDLRGFDMMFEEEREKEATAADTAVATGVIRATTRLGILKLLTMIKVMPFKSFKPGAWSTLQELQASAERKNLPIHHRVAQIVRKEGVHGIYNRTVPFYMGNSVGSVVLFGIYGALCRHPLTVSPTPYPSEHLPLHRWLYHQGRIQRDVLSAGALAGLGHGLVYFPCSLWVTYALDRAKGRVAAGQRERLLAELRAIGAQRVAAVAARDATAFALFFAVFEGTKQSTRRTWERIFTRWYRVDDPALWTVGATALVAGGGAGVAHALASLTLTPILGLAAGVQAAARAPRVRSMPRGEFWARVAWASIPNALSFLALEVIFFEIGLMPHIADLD